MNCTSVPAWTKTLLEVLEVPEKVTLPLNRPPPTDASVYRLVFGFRTVNRDVEKVSESLSVTIMTWTLAGGAPASFGSSTVISTDSSHSYRLVRSTVMVAHWPPAGFPGVPNRLQAGACGGAKADSSFGWNSSHSKTTSSRPKP